MMFNKSNVVWVQKKDWPIALCCVYMGKLFPTGNVLKLHELKIQEFEYDGYITANNDEIFGTLEDASIPTTTQSSLD